MERRQSNSLQHQPSSVPGSPVPMQRRESLVKPTWHNVCPGDVPADTFEKLNKLSNGERNQLNQLNQYEGSGSPKAGDELAACGSNNNNAIVNKASIAAQRRQVDLYDIFGKVKHMKYIYK